MIIAEFLAWLLKKAGYAVSRPVIWLVTARDCRHCKHGMRGYANRYCVRPTFALYNTREDVDKLVIAVRKIVGQR